MNKTDKERIYKMLMASEKTNVEMVLPYLKKIGVPEDGRWQTLILYLRYISEYSYLSTLQKQKIQDLLVDVITRRTFSEEEYNNIMKEFSNIMFEPYKEKLKEALKESAELLKKFSEVSKISKKHIENLEQNTVEIIEKTNDIELSIKKVKQAFKSVVTLLDKDIKKLYEEVRMDGLTSLYNRKFLDMFLDKILIKCKQNKIPCCIVMFDIDDFKKINDTYGHRVGDQALIIVAKIIKKKGEGYLKKGHKGNLFPVRYGGEEFCIVAEGFTCREGYDIGEIIRKGVESYNFIIRDKEGNIVEDGIKITISGGVSTTYNGKKTGWELIEEADIALYRAKRSGKNRIEMYK